MGFAKISVMDHLWQIEPVGPIDAEMLEAYAALGANVDTILSQLEALSKLGVTHVHGWVPQVASITPLEILGERLIPKIADW